MNAMVPWDLLRKSLRVNAKRTALVTSDEEWTYTRLDSRSASLAVELIGQTAAGDRVALLLGNTAEYVVADLAVQRSGLVKVPLNPMLSAEDINYIVAAAECSVLLMKKGIHAQSHQILEAAVAAGVTVSELDVSGEDPVAPEAEIASTRVVDPAAPATMLFTGGTTGRPKGILHSAGSVASNYIAHVMEGEVRDGELMILASALSHSAGLFLLAGLTRGATIHLTDKFDAAGYVDTIERHGLTWGSVVPTMLYRALDELESSGRRLPSLRTLIYGSAPITPTRLAQAVELLGPVLIQLYGQSEVPNWGTTLSKSDHQLAQRDPEILSSCGRPSTMVDVLICDEEGHPVPNGTTGEICLRAPYQMVEYWRNPEATAATVVDGWVHTRDVGCLDDDGYLFIKDRLSDMIITGGYNVYSSEVESAVQTIPAVAQVAAVGVPDPDWGEAVCAVVVLRHGFDLSEADLLAGSRTLLSSYKRPKSIRIVPEIPVTPFGKPDKKAIRAELARSV
ncbi:fatty-acid--CoA ligase FadD8 [Microbacterium aoyamense]|uniref:Fatty-acid--CoA ligase FadD8 n=1 Tax=Microbacterium aoyamense TaxID=344166 RepID=A0ABP5AQU9_9MICO|nr:AMP-binding protein [Microbacterium aoyamense]